MKKRIWSTVLLAGVLVGCGESGGYKVEGDLKGLSGEVYLNVDGQMMDTATVENGKFVFKGKMDRPSVAILMNDQGPITSFFLENSRIVLTGEMDSQQIKATGTPSNDRYGQIREQLMSRVERYMAAVSEDEKQAAMASFDSLLWASIDANLDNILGVALLYQAAQGDDPDRVVALIGEFSEEMQNHPMMEEARRIASVARKTAIGQAYMEIQLPDAEGKTVALSSLVGQGRYVLLDFWASWCGPCREEFPYLVEAYKKYRGKGFGIYGVSLDQDREEWLKAMDRYGLDWTNVMAADASQSTAAQDYGINSIPANFLIAPDGKIVARDLRGEDVAKKLEELLK